MLHVSAITPEDVGKAIGKNENEIWSFANNFEVCFKPRRMQAVGRKHRPIDPLYKAPKKLLKRLHAWFQQQGLYHPQAHGGIRKRSCFTSAGKHLGRKIVWTRDASNCYPSVTPEAFYKELITLGFRNDTARLLTKLCTVRGQIPQGSPVSGDALNLFFYRIDQALSSFCGSRGLSYTRVADDFVIAGNNLRSGIEATRIVERFLGERGISVNRKKRKQSGFQPRSGGQFVHSINVARGTGTAITPDHRAKAMSVAEQYVEACKSIQPDSLQGVAALRGKLHGWMHYCRQAHHSPAKYLRRQLETGDRTVRHKLRSLRITAHKNKWWLVTKKRNEPRRIVAVWRARMRTRAGTGSLVCASSAS